MIGLFVIGLLSIIPVSFSQPIEKTTITSINDEISLETTITIMSIPKNNILPWGTVHGMITDPAERYPVIIQFFKGEDPVHIAQVDVKGDNSYEYKFRVRSVDDGKVTNVFEGDYEVRIFKVINKPQNNLDLI
ncbi:MAG: hypothetical protein COA77_10275 [Thaumarchaeota archaeon]|nr:MAG: hypothetical protein COA77_10275 [Nitrososphaerota archaeon]